jgi:hypothetical protein
VRRSPSLESPSADPDGRGPVEAIPCSELALRDATTVGAVVVEIQLKDDLNQLVTRSTSWNPPTGPTSSSSPKTVITEIRATAIHFPAVDGGIAIEGAGDRGATDEMAFVVSILLDSDAYFTYAPRPNRRIFGISLMSTVRRAVELACNLAGSG